MMMGRTSRRTRDEGVYPHGGGVYWQKKRRQGEDVRPYICVCPCLLIPFLDHDRVNVI